VHIPYTAKPDPFPLQNAVLWTIDTVPPDTWRLTASSPSTMVLRHEPTQRHRTEIAFGECSWCWYDEQRISCGSLGFGVASNWESAMETTDIRLWSFHLPPVGRCELRSRRLLDEGR